MSNPMHIGDLAAAVVQAARLRREQPREQRLELGAATLLAFLIHAHGDDAEAVLLEASEQYVHTHTRAFRVAQQSLAGLEAVATVCEAVHTHSSRDVLAAVLVALDTAHRRIEYEQRATVSFGKRETLPPCEDRHASSLPR